ncbi:MAG: NusG domain II-containing protein [Aminipila sp.]
MIKKADIALAIILIIFGSVIAFMTASSATKGDTVLITTDGKEFARYPLVENREITVEQNNHTNEIIIKDGRVSMSFSDCSNQVCVHTGSISQTTQSIICLPNKVMVQIIGKGEPEYDAISN